MGSPALLQILKQQIRHGLIKAQMIYSNLQRVKHSYLHQKTSTQLSKTLCLSKHFHGTPYGDKAKWIDQFLQKAFDIIILSCTHGLNLKWHHSWIKGSMSGESVIPKSVITKDYCPLSTQHLKLRKPCLQFQPKYLKTPQVLIRMFSSLSNP